LLTLKTNFKQENDSTDKAYFHLKIVFHLTRLLLLAYLWGKVGEGQEHAVQKHSSNLQADTPAENGSFQRPVS